MMYLIGGPARCGKSTLARRVRSEINAQMISGDAATHAMQNGFVKPEWLPDLFEHIVDPFKLKKTSEEKIDRLRRRDLAMWRFYEEYFKSASHGSSDDILLEGNIWPDSLATLAPAYRAVFLIDTSPKQAGRLIKIRDGDDANNWMKQRNYSDEKIKEWATFNVARSQRYTELCEKYGYDYFDVAEHGIEQAQQLAFESLLQKTV